MVNVDRVSEQLAASRSMLGDTIDCQQLSE